MAKIVIIVIIVIFKFVMQHGRNTLTSNEEVSEITICRAALVTEVVGLGRLVGSLAPPS